MISIACSLSFLGAKLTKNCRGETSSHFGEVVTNPKGKQLFVGCHFMNRSGAKEGSSSSTTVVWPKSHKEAANSKWGWAIPPIPCFILSADSPDIKDLLYYICKISNITRYQWIYGFTIKLINRYQSLKPAL